MKKRAKPKWRIMRFRKKDHTHNLMAAAVKWIHANGGTAVVIGGVEVQDWGEGAYKYRVALNVVGQKPAKKKPEGAA